MNKSICLLGSTGSVGRQTLNVVRNLGPEVKVVGLAARSNIDLLEAQIKEFSPEIVAVFEEKGALELKRRHPGLNVVCGVDGLCEVASWHSANFVLLAMVGSKGILPAIKAIESGKDIGLANKEILVSAGEYIHHLAKKHHVRLLPVDSEHSAILQCLQGEEMESVKRLILTASGGPFLHRSMEELQSVTKLDAIKHPTWNMGDKISIDSSTLMNKGLEVMEARWLFDLPVDKIEVVIHPQSLVHSFVEFVDGSMKAQISVPDMELPIQYALTYPERKPRPHKHYNFLQAHTYEFFPPNLQKFQCLQLAYDALRKGGTYPCFLNAANEVLVERFCQGEVRWLDIPEKLKILVDRQTTSKELSIDSILEIDREARLAASII